MQRSFFSLAMTVVLAASAQAGITDIKFVSVDNSAQAELADYVTTDIMLDFTGQLTGVQLLVGDGTAGTIYQNGSGTATAPSNQFIGFVPALAFDSYLTFGARTSDGADFKLPNVGGFAIDLGSAGPATFSNGKIDQAYNLPAGTIVTDQTDYMVARLSLSKSFSGDFSILASAAGEITTETISVMNGVIGGDVGGGDPIAVGDPVSGSAISLQGAFDDGTGELLGAIMVMNDNPGSDDPLTFDASDLVFTSNDEGLFSAAINASDPTKIDLFIDVAAALNGPRRDVAAVLEIQTNGGTLTYNLGARVPEPSTVALSALALVGLVGFARRKK